MHNRAENHDEVLGLRDNHYLLVVPAMGLRDGFDVINDWNLDRKGNYGDREAAVEKAREIAARSGSFDGVIVHYPPGDPNWE